MPARFRKMWLVAAFAWLSATLQARDYYVSVSGTNAAGTESSPASVAQLKTFLAAYDVATDNTLNVIFYAGTYTVPAGGFSFNTTASKVGGLEVDFRPADGASVTLAGTSSGNTKLLHLNAGVSADLPLKVTVENMTIRDFASTVDKDNGEGSLFTVRDYNTLTLESVYISNISSRQNPLLAIYSNATFNVSGSTVDNIFIASGGEYGVFQSVGDSNGDSHDYALNFTGSTLSNWKTLSAGDYCYMFYLESKGSISMDECTVSGFSKGRAIFGYRGDRTEQNFTANNTVFDSNTPANSIVQRQTGSGNIVRFRFAGCTFNLNTPSGPLFALSNCTTDFIECLFTKNTAQGSCGFDIDAQTTVNDCIFDSNTVNGNGSVTSLFYFHNTSSPFVITGSTVSKTSVVSGMSGSRYLIYTGTSSSAYSFTAINNTFSGNDYLTQAVYTLSTTGAFINNTLYNSGGITTRDNTAATLVANNLLIGSGSLAGNASRLQRNIVNNTFYASGNTGGTACNTGGYVDPALTEYAPGSPKIHHLLNIASNPVLKKGGEVTAAIYGNYLDYLGLDQRNRSRPAKISVGAVDVTLLALEDGHYTIFYDDRTGLLPSYTIDIRKYIESYPDEVDTAAIQFNIVTQPVTGNVTAGSKNYFFNFAPLIDGSSPAKGTLDYPSTMKYTATYGDYTVSATLTITIVDVRLPSGIIDDSYVKCFAEMGNTDFNADYKFVTLGINATRYDGFSVPLVGDLNGDGKPEIVAIGLESTSTSASLGGSAAYLCILNGQTGKEIVRYPFPSRWEIRDPVHNTPSWIALVDADRDGQAEIVVACGYTPGKYNKKLVSYEVNAETFKPVTPSMPPDDKRRLTEKWISSARYDLAASGVADNKQVKAAPLPQIADINEDGVPEILVYNKIYNALNGQLLVTLEQLEPNSQWSNRSATIAQIRDYAYIGRNRYTGYRDNMGLNFSYIYDLDGNGQMEVIAGGKAYYDINLATGTYKVKSADHAFNLGVGDGFTAVADINSDGKAEIVVVSYADANQNSLRIRVWDPGFSGNIATTPAVLLADVTVPFEFSGRLGSMSYVYIGDIDGKTDASGKKYPEISVLGPRFYKGTAIPAHPNLPANTFNGFSYSSAAHGALMSWTWDAAASTLQGRLKVSFLLEHDDASINTGFTMFDFDNDGVEEICYRDEVSLRIISASQPLVKLNETNSNIIKFKGNVLSYTGYEYPVVADIDGDGSADMIVMGSNVKNDARGYIYAVQANPAKTRFAPAPKVWNQFMYSPLKINEDLTTPRFNLHPLSPGLAYVSKKDKDSKVKTYVYNNTITQVVKSALFTEQNAAGETVTVLKPIVFLPDAQVYNLKINPSPATLTLSIRNSGNSTLNAATPVKIFRGMSAGYVPSGYYARMKLGSDLFPGDSITLTYPFTGNADLGYNYTVRVADSTYNASSDLFMKYYKDCNWANNVAETGSFLIRNDAVTVLNGTTVTIDVLANDVLPAGCSGQLTAGGIVTPGGAGVLTGDFGTFAINNNRLEYTAPDSYPAGVVEVTYSITCSGASSDPTRTAKLYIYIVEPCVGLTAFKGCPYRLCLKENPAGKVKFEWYAPESVYLGIDFPWIFNPLADESFYVKPRVTGYETVDFPKLKLILYVTDFQTGPIYRSPNLK